MQIAPLASGSTRGLARQQVTRESDDTDRSHTRCIGHDMITMGTKALTRGIEQLDLLVAALCGVVLLLEGIAMAAIGSPVPSIADAWQLAPFPQRYRRAMLGCCLDRSASGCSVIGWAPTPCS